jgi:5-methylcytosine-specific restriction endonuclease McrA
MSATIDHIKPLSKGGEHSYANTALAHYGCNARKRDRYEEVA